MYQVSLSISSLARSVFLSHTSCRAFPVWCPPPKLQFIFNSSFLRQHVFCFQFEVGQYNLDFFCIQNIVVVHDNNPHHTISNNVYYLWQLSCLQTLKKTNVLLRIVEKPRMQIPSSLPCRLSSFHFLFIHYHNTLRQMCTNSARAYKMMVSVQEAGDTFELNKRAATKFVGHVSANCSCSTLHVPTKLVIVCYCMLGVVFMFRCSPTGHLIDVLAQA